MRVDGNAGATIAYEPNSYEAWQEQKEFAEPELDIDGGASRWEMDDDNFTQPRMLFQLMSKAQQQVLFENTARAMGDAPEMIKQRHIANCTKANPAYGAGVAKTLGLSVKS